MLARIAIPLIGAAGLIFACSPRNQSPSATARPKSGADRGVVSHVMVDTSKGKVGFVIEVTNESPKRTELTFSSGKSHEFIVLDSTGQEVWRWSKGRLFTQTMQARLLEAYDSAIFRELWSPEKPGHYTLIAELYSEDHPVRQNVDFSLR